MGVGACVQPVPSLRTLLTSVGSMLALGTPFIANSVHDNHEESHELCLEYGSATQVYLVPIAQQDEQVGWSILALLLSLLLLTKTENIVCVLLTPTQVRSQGPRLSCLPTDNMASQVTLPRDLHGSVDFSKYPFGVYASDLHDKMVGVSLFGTVISVCKASASGSTFYLEKEDVTGVVLMKLNFIGHWSLGRVAVGHMVYISGLSLYLEFNKHICCDRLDHIDCNSLKVLLFHNLCGCNVNEQLGGLQCSFCKCACHNGCIHDFQLHLTIADDSEKVFAWYVGQTAVEFLQISSDEYMELPEDDGQYISSLFRTRALQSPLQTPASRSMGIPGSGKDEALLMGEIARAQKCE